MPDFFKSSKNSDSKQLGLKPQKSASPGTGYRGEENEQEIRRLANLLDKALMPLKGEDNWVKALEGCISIWPFISLAATEKTAKQRYQAPSKKGQVYWDRIHSYLQQWGAQTVREVLDMQPNLSEKTAQGLAVLYWQHVTVYGRNLSDRITREDIAEALHATTRSITEWRSDGLIEIVRRLNREDFDKANSVSITQVPSTLSLLNILDKYGSYWLFNKAALFVSRMGDHVQEGELKTWEEKITEYLSLQEVVEGPIETWLLFAIERIKTLARRGMVREGWVATSQLLPYRAEAHAKLWSESLETLLEHSSIQKARMEKVQWRIKALIEWEKVVAAPDHLLESGDSFRDLMCELVAEELDIWDDALADFQRPSLPRPIQKVVQQLRIQVRVQSRVIPALDAARKGEFTTAQKHIWSAPRNLGMASPLPMGPLNGFVVVLLFYLSIYAPQNLGWLNSVLGRVFVGWGKNWLPELAPLKLILGRIFFYTGNLFAALSSTLYKGGGHRAGTSRSFWYDWVATHHSYLEVPDVPVRPYYTRSGPLPALV